MTNCLKVIFDDQFLIEVAIFRCFEVCSVQPPQIFQVQTKISTVRLSINRLSFRFLRLLFWWSILKSNFHLSKKMSLKSDFHLPKKIYFICFNDSPSKMLKNAFYFILKALFVFKIFKFLSSLFEHVEKTAWLER